ncbi:peptide chain release factor N(5)-glutamine methyltransferase [Desulfovibrio cuneatus]|uniref:peptide chain release factor N(5)-glutamine methyltransferase n=1 Tax=Desulfovibrio cuneatus TaxID=159728 RepID=UPI0004223677|nr:peptide chain release factor N(5)-glutamine methyltransferase [Desulfovibrio cuneatus]
MPNPLLHNSLRQFTALLHQHGVDSPRLSAEVLLAHTLGMDRNDFLKTCLLTPNMPLDAELYARAEALILRRSTGEPVAYLIGEKEFYGRAFGVTASTLVPRPETELLVETAVSFFTAPPARNTEAGYFIDCGTGSGCIAITLALELPFMRGIAVDTSRAALQVAKTNAARHHVSSLLFAQADFTMPVMLPQSMHLFVANPPYISQKEYEGLCHEVRHFEPATALVPRRSDNAVAPATGLEDLEALVRQAATALRPDGLLLMEMGHTQGSAVLAMLQHAKWQEARIIADLAGLDRIAMAVRTAK